MIKEILKACDYSLFSEIALLMFVGIFVVVSIRALVSSRQESQRQAQIVLSDAMESEGYESTNK